VKTSNDRSWGYMSGNELRNINKSGDCNYVNISITKQRKVLYLNK